MNLPEDFDKHHIWHPYSPISHPKENIEVERAQGAYIYAKDGRRFIDAISSWWVNLHGHSHPYIAEKIYEQALKAEHVIFAGFTHEPALKISYRLLQLFPYLKRVFFSDNGSTAVEVALKMSLQYWQLQNKPRKKIIALEGAFHGDTFGAMAVSERGIFTNVFSDLLFDVSFIPFPSKQNEEASILRLEEELKSGEAACFIYEPLLQGAAGMRCYSPEVLDKMIALCNSYGTLCIADEIFTGFGRTGKNFASDYLSNKPDLVCLSKGLTGGTMPMSITICSEKVEKPFLYKEGSVNLFYHGHSFTGNPLACAAANASLDLLLEENCQKRIKNIEESHKSFLNKILPDKKILRAESLGVMLAIELKTLEKTGYLNSIKEFLTNFFLNKGILIRPLGNVIYFLPPYNIEEQDIYYIYNAIEELLEEI
ncbi:MAG: adenosylmethionine--8-amino-7-oxononanoate transaminase [Cytophagaceae bacterium]